MSAESYSTPGSERASKSLSTAAKHANHLWYASVRTAHEHEVLVSKWRHLLLMFDSQVQGYTYSRAIAVRPKISPGRPCHLRDSGPTRPNAREDYEVFEYLDLVLKY